MSNYRLKPQNSSGVSGFSRLRFSAYARDLEQAILSLSEEANMPHGWPIKPRISEVPKPTMSDAAPVTPLPANELVPAEEPKPVVPAEPLKRNVTGASSLGSSIQTLIAAIKGEVDAAHADLHAAAGEVRSGINSVKSVAKALRGEADDIKSSLGQFSNGGPE